jgi:hypothetical protein
VRCLRGEPRLVTDATCTSILSSRQEFHVTSPGRPIAAWYDEGHQEDKSVAGTAQRTESGVRWLSDEEAHAMFDSEARRVMGISGEEFLRRYDAGEFQDVHDDGENLDFVELEMLIPFGR